MFQRLRKLRLPFLPKKLIEVPLEELIVSAREEAKNYPLIQDNDQLDELFKSKFMTKNGVQLPPKELITNVIDHIEKSPPQSPEEFAVFVQKTIVEMSARVVTKKK